jgi:hypothetical protein
LEDPAELRSACTGEDARAYTARANGSACTGEDARAYIV